MVRLRTLETSFPEISQVRGHSYLLLNQLDQITTIRCGSNYGFQLRSAEDVFVIFWAATIGSMTPTPRSAGLVNQFIWNRTQSKRNGPLQNVPARYKTGLLKCLTACHIFWIAPCCRDTPAFVADSFEFLDQVSSQTAFAK